MALGSVANALTSVSLSVPYWVDAGATAWDTLVLFGPNSQRIQFPGIATVSGKIQYDIVVSKNNGQDAAFTTDKGRKPTEFDVSLKLVGADQWSAWLAVMSQFNFGATGKARSPYSIFHPKAQELGVGTIIIQSIVTPAPNSADAYVVTIKMIEYVKAPKTTRTNPATLASTGINSTLPAAPGTNGGQL